MKAIERLGKQADPTGHGIVATAVSVALDAQEMHETDAARAFVYAVNKFAQQRDRDDNFTLASLSASLDRLLSETVARVAEFRSTLDRRGFKLVFQPIVWLDGRPGSHHQEALTRLPDGSSPFQLVSFAEEVGFVAEFDLAVVHKTLSILDTTPHSADIAVNISGRSLESQVFAAELMALVKQFPSLRRRMLIEITESSRIGNLDGVAAVVRNLRDLGHRVCLDDFGAGAAAFHYLRAFAVDIVKIDGGYVKNITTDTRDRAFVKSIVGLCRELEIKTIAEMVETEEQAVILRQIGVDLAQGYLYARPVEQVALQAPPQGPPNAQRLSATRHAARREGYYETWE
jgi:EAL domain-containing protein (putative c-di-GMP-specific phosphodiesterase class I)